VCGESRKHGSAGGQGFLRERLPYPAGNWRRRASSLAPPNCVAEDFSALNCDTG